jgi:hypothetical protein
LEWLGHVIRKNETRSVKKIFEGKLEGRRGRGRPRLRWINVNDDLSKLGVKRWRTKALDREEWASIIREAKAKLKGPCYRKKIQGQLSVIFWWITGMSECSHITDKIRHRIKGKQNV